MPISSRTYIPRRVPVVIIAIDDDASDAIDV
jgi:hypothetical protein